MKIRHVDSVIITHGSGYSKIVIINIGRALDKLYSYINVSWMPVIDIDALLSIIFSCYYSVQNLDENTDNTVNWLMNDGFEFKELTLMQHQYIVKVIKEVMQDIYDELLHTGLLTTGYFPYEYKQRLPDNSVVLTIANST